MNSTIAPPPSGRKVTPADEKAFPLYLQVLDLVRAGTHLDSIARTVFGLRQPTRADRKMIERYYERAVWMTQTGWQQLADGDVGNVAVYGLFMSKSISDLRLGGWKDSIGELIAQDAFRMFVAAVAMVAGADQHWRWSDELVIKDRTPEGVEPSAIQELHEKCLRALTQDLHHALWPALVLMAYARLARNARSNKATTATSHAMFFFAVLARALDENDAKKVASATSTLMEPLRSVIVDAVSAEVREIVLELAISDPGDTAAMMLAPIDYGPSVARG